MTIFLHPVRINRNFGLARLYCSAYRLWRAIGSPLLPWTSYVRWDISGRIVTWIIVNEPILQRNLHAYLVLGRVYTRTTGN
jgi:hypothetical protein